MPQRGYIYAVPPRPGRPQRQQRWLVRIYLGLDPATRKPRYKSRSVTGMTGTREDAERALEELKWEYGIS